MIYGYVRQEKNPASEENQRESIASFADGKGLHIDMWLDAEDKSALSALKQGDTVIVGQLFRFARDIAAITQTLQMLLENGVVIMCAADGLKMGGDDSAATMASCFGLIAKVAKENRIQTSRENLEFLKKSGKKLGRPTGTVNKNLCLDNRYDDIVTMCRDGYSKARISRALDVDTGTLSRFMQRHPELNEAANAS